MKRILFCAAAALVIAGAALAQPVPSPVQPAPVKRTILGKTDVPGSNYEVLFASVELQPGFKAGRHTHPGTVIVQILQGEFFYAPDGQPEKIFKAGETVEVPAGTVHNEGAVGSVVVKFIGTYVVEKGKPLVSPVQ